MQKVIAIILLTLGSLNAQEELESADALIRESAAVSKEPGAVSFTPPSGWKAADPKLLPPHVKVLVVGKGEHVYPPSINLGVDAHKGTLKEYLQIVKAINDADSADWKDLGGFNTESGKGNLSQVDMRTEWGDVRLMHVIVQKGDAVYILTASALKSEFPKFYKPFLAAMRSLKINDS